jgi:hypothetical protein
MGEGVAESGNQKRGRSARPDLFSTFLPPRSTYAHPCELDWERQRLQRVQRQMPFFKKLLACRTMGPSEEILPLSGVVQGQSRIGSLRKGEFGGRRPLLNPGPL